MISLTIDAWHELYVNQNIVRIANMASGKKKNIETLLIHTRRVTVTVTKRVALGYNTRLAVVAASGSFIMTT